MLDDSIRRVRMYLIRNKDGLKHWMAVAIDGAKIGIFAAGSVGLYILVAYLQSVRAPLPISDFSTLQTLLIIAATYIFVAGFVFAVFYFPIFTCLVPRKARVHIRVQTLSYHSYKQNWIEQLGSQPLLFHGSSALVIPTYSVIRMSPASDNASFFWLSIALFFGALTSVTVFYLKAIIPNRIQNFKIKLGFRVFTGSLTRGGWCIAWLHIIATFNLAFPIIRSSQGSFLGRITTWTVFLCVTSFLYFGLTSVKTRPERLPVVIVLGLLGALAYYPSFFSQRTLHLLGIGGGIPIELLVKTMDRDETTIVARPVKGCLVLNTGSRVILQVMDVPTVDGCDRTLSQDERGYATMYKGITILSGSDIIKMSGYSFPTQ